MQRRRGCDKGALAVRGLCQIAIDFSDSLQPAAAQTFTALAESSMAAGPLGRRCLPSCPMSPLDASPDVASGATVLPRIRSSIGCHTHSLATSSNRCGFPWRGKEFGRQPNITDPTILHRRVPLLATAKGQALCFALRLHLPRTAQSRCHCTLIHSARRGTGGAADDSRNAGESR